MKKYLLLLLISTFAIGQTNPTAFKKIKVTDNVENTTPAFIGTQETDGVINKIPSTYIEKTANKTSTITGYSETLYPNEKATHDALDTKLNISDLPTNLTLYPTTAASDIAGYVKMVTDIHDVDYNTVAVDVSTPLITTTNQLISSRISAAGVLIGQPGVFNITTFGNIRHLSGSGTASFYFEVYKRTSAGVETLICTSSNSLPVTNGGYSEFSASGVWDDGIFLETDRIVIKSYANRIAGGSDPVYQFQFGGVSPVRTILPVPFSVVDAGYEIKINKQNSLAVDGTGVKYTTVDATNAGLALKQNTLTNPITGTGTANTIPKFTATNTLGDGSIRDNVNVSIGTGGFSNKLTLYSNANEYALRVGQNTSNVTNSFTGITFYNSTNTGGTGTSTGTASLKISRTPANLMGNLAFLLGSTQVGMFDDYGHLLIATPTSNGLDGIQTPLTISHAPATLANQGVVKSQLDLKADLASPTFTGVPSVPTATIGTNTTQIASTAFVSGALSSGNYQVSVNRTESNLIEHRIFNNSTTTVSLENNYLSGIFRQAVNFSSGTHNRLRNESTGVGNRNINVAGGIFNSNLNDINTGIFNDNSNTGTGFFNKNTNSSTGVFSDSFNVGTGFFDKRRNDSTGILNYYDSNAGSTGDLQQYLKAGVVTAKINHLGELTSPKITIPTLGGGPSRIVSADVNGELSASSVFTHYGQIAVTNSVSANSFIKTGGTPSQFLKADGSIDESDVIKNIAKDAAQGANITGTVSETILYSKLIPANTFKDGDFMNLFNRVAKSGVLGTLTQRVRINTSNTLTGSILIASNLMVTANQLGNLYRNFTISNGFLTGISNGVSTNDLINTNASAQFNVFDPTVDNYIFITGQMSNASDTMFNLGTKITN